MTTESWVTIILIIDTILLLAVIGIMAYLLYVNLSGGNDIFNSNLLWWNSGPAFAPSTSNYLGWGKVFSTMVQGSIIMNASGTLRNFEVGIDPSVSNLTAGVVFSLLVNGTSVSTLTLTSITANSGSSDLGTVKPGDLVAVQVSQSTNSTTNLFGNNSLFASVHLT